MVEARGPPSCVKARALGIAGRKCVARRSRGRRGAGFGIPVMVTLCWGALVASGAAAFAGAAFSFSAVRGVDDVHFSSLPVSWQHPAPHALLAGKRRERLPRQPQTRRLVQGGRSSYPQQPPNYGGYGGGQASTPPYGTPGHPGGSMEEDPFKLLQQLLSGEATPGTGQQGFPGAGGTGGFGGAAGGAGTNDPLMSMLTGMGGGGLGGMGGGPKQKPSDSFFTTRFPVLQKAKLVVLPAFFAYCYFKGWIGVCGLIQGAMAKSYFEMLAVPLRILPSSPLHGKAFFVASMWVDLGFRAVGYLINLARGKAKLPSMPQMPPQAQGAPAWPTPSTSPERTAAAAYASAESSSAPTSAPPPPPSTKLPRSSEPPVIDADVTFLN